MKSAIGRASTGNSDLDRALSAIKQNLDDITGQNKRRKPMTKLPSDATLPQVITLLNEIVDRLQG